MNTRARRSLVEFGGAIGGVATLLLVLFLYTGTWPPAVVVESGSMMHENEPFGRLGTIDVGDLVLVKKINGRGDVELNVDKDAHDTYSGRGDVVLYERDGDATATPVIHRAMSWIEVDGAGANRTYRLLLPDGYHDFGTAGVAWPAFGFDASHVCCPTGAYKPTNSGFVTKGDNARTNTATDQALGITREPVKPEWVLGVARGEIPWLGLVKLVFANDFNDYSPDWWRVGNAYAPGDAWLCLILSLVVVIGAPIGIDFARARMRARRGND
ncbi:MAG: S26 family signal peptidase [Thermoplasmatota archaeon]